MSTLIAEVHACQGCGACLLTCPEHAIRPRGATLLVQPERCTGCGECVEVCPVDAIVLRPTERPTQRPTARPSETEPSR